MIMEKKSITKSCQSCFCRPVCKHAKNTIDAMISSAHNQTGEFIKEANISISEILAAGCKHFSSTDRRDFVALEEKNESLEEQLNEVRDLASKKP